MKIIPFLIAGLIGSCFLPEYLWAQDQTGQTMVMTAKINGMAPGQQLYYGLVSSSKRDSVLTESGGFNLRIAIPEGQGDTYIFKLDRKTATDATVTIYLERGTVNITGDGPDFKDIKFSGSQFIQDYNAAINYANGIADAKLAMLKAASLDGELSKADLNEGKKLYSSALRSWVGQHPNAAYSAAYLYESRKFIVPNDTLKMLFKRLTPAAKNSVPGRALEETFSDEERLSVGKMAPEFTLPDVSGKPVSLKDFRGKYVLVDFWASWCIWCRGGHPELRQNFYQYEDHGFTVVGVSLDVATDKSKWINAIRDDRLPWVQLSDLKGFKSGVASLYGITSIPKNVLIDPEGKIIARNLQTGELAKRLEELLGDKE